MYNIKKEEEEEKKEESTHFLIKLPPKKQKKSSKKGQKCWPFYYAFCYAPKHNMFVSKH